MLAPLAQLDEIAAAGLTRQLHRIEAVDDCRVQIQGRWFENFASNDYLGLSRHPAVADRMIAAIREFGTGATGSRLVCGTHAPHLALEEALAAAKGSSAALTFSSGFATAAAIISCVLEPGDFIVLDRLSHASLIDAAKASPATTRIFPHQDPAALDRILARIRTRHAGASILVATESVFSMDGDVCPLAELVAVCERRGADLLLDEAHGVGVLGPTGMGLAEQLGLQDRVKFQMGTLSKAFGLSGGYLAAPRAWIDLLVNRARSFIYTTAPPPAIAAAALAALEIIRSNEGRELRATLRTHAANLHAATRNAGPTPTPIIPLILGSNAAAMTASAQLRDLGFLVPAIRFPTVPKDSARLRISISAAHDRAVVAGLAAALKRLSGGM